MEEDIQKNMGGIRIVPRVKGKIQIASNYCEALLPDETPPSSIPKGKDFKKKSQWCTYKNDHTQKNRYENS